jgi:shikimate kinase
MSTRPGGPAESTKSAPGSTFRSIVLVGFMGAGKSSVGACLSRHLGWPFEDLDERIQTREQRSIEEIFRQSGEAAFREMEHAALRSLLSELGLGDSGSGAKVVALGGGAFAQPNNVALIEEAGLSTVFLDAPAEELFRRCQEQQVERPLRGEAQEFERLYADRRRYYLKAGLRIETAGKDVEEVAAEAITRLGLR